MTWLFILFAAALGAVVGSFLNVVIHRYPREESIVFPPSRCPDCGTPIKPYDNVPVLAYLWLLGRCRACRAPISVRYPLVELANALFYVAIYQRTGMTWGFLAIAFVYISPMERAQTSVVVGVDGTSETFRYVFTANFPRPVFTNQTSLPVISRSKAE